MTRISKIMLIALGFAALGAPTLALADDGNPLEGKRVVLKKAEIRALAEQQKFLEAETAYLGWSSYWRQDDSKLTVDIERGFLNQAHKGGKFSALVAMVQSGDEHALETLRALMGGADGLPAGELATAIRILGDRKDKTALNTVLLALYHDDKAVVNAAITALGKIGDARAKSDLLRVLDNADAEQSILAARALNQIGAGAVARKRFTAQMKFQLAGKRESAALALAAIGDVNAWGAVKQLIADKNAPFYPLALSVLGDMPVKEARPIVLSALGGNEEEQAAALQSVKALPRDEVEGIVLGMLRDPNHTPSVQIACIRFLAARGNTDMIKDLWGIASNNKAGISARIEAMLTLGKYDLLWSPSNMERVRQNIVAADFEDDANAKAAAEEVALAARGVLLGHAMVATRYGY